MDASIFVKRDFCRRLFRVGGATANERAAFLDGLSDVANKSLQSGKILIEATSSATTAKYQPFTGWTPGTLIELIETARDWAVATDLNTALALINDQIKCTGFECTIRR